MIRGRLVKVNGRIVSTFTVIGELLLDVGWEHLCKLIEATGGRHIEVEGINIKAADASFRVLVPCRRIEGVPI